MCNTHSTSAPGYPQEQQHMGVCAQGVLLNLRVLQCNSSTRPGIANTHA